MVAIQFGSGKILLAEIVALKNDFSWMNRLAYGDGKKPKSDTGICYTSDDRITELELPGIDEICFDNWDFEYERKRWNLPTLKEMKLGGLV